MRSRKIILTLIATLVVIFAVNLKTRTRAVKAQSAAFTIKYASAAGKQLQPPQPTETLYARRADGSQVESRMRTAPDGKQYNQRILYDTVKGARVVINGMTESITTYPLWPRQVANLRHPSLSCDAGGSNLPESTILGERTVQKTITAPTPDKRRKETWLAPELGCTILREITIIPGKDGHDVQLVSKEAVSLTPGDPDESLFQVPTWPEQSPSQALAEFARRFNAPLEVVPQFDRAYQSTPRLRQQQ